MRKLHNIEDRQSSDMTHIASPAPIQEQELPQSFIYSWLQPLLEQITSYLGQRITQDDLDLLSMSLYHLYRSIDRLYCITLPELAAFLAMSSENKEHHYLIWLRLRQIKRTLERIEIVCHLLSGTLTSILGALDSLDMVRGKKEGKRFALSSTLGSRAAAFEQLQHRLEEWQSYFVEHQTLLLDLTKQLPTTAKGDNIDRGWGIVLLSAMAVYGDILPDVQGIGDADDEATATLILDLAQQTDQILLQTEAMLEPFPQLIKHYAHAQEV